MSQPVLSDLDLNSAARILGLLTPVSNDEAVRKDYVDNLVSGTLYSGTAASGTVTFGSVSFNTNTAPELWLVRWIGYNPANSSQAGIMIMQGYVSRGTGLPVVGQIASVADALAGTQSIIMSSTGSNVFVQFNLGSATNISWKARLQRLPYASF